MMGFIFRYQDLQCALYSTCICICMAHRPAIRTLISTTDRKPKKKKGKKDYAYITRLGLGWESEFSGLQIHGIRRRFYSNDNILMRYAQRYIMSRDG